MLGFLRAHVEVEANQADHAFSADELAARLADKDGVPLMPADRLDASVLARAARLRAVCNIAVGSNNIDVGACTARGIMVTNTPGASRPPGWTCSKASRR